MQPRQTEELAERFLEAMRREVAPSTIWKYRWALRCLWREWPVLPRNVTILIRFADGEPLAENQKRVLWGVLRRFYTWVNARDAEVPELPNVSFGRRRAGERRGIRRRRLS